MGPRKEEESSWIRKQDSSGLFFYGLLLAWAVSLAAKMILHGRTDLWAVVGGTAFFALANMLTEVLVLKNEPLLSKVSGRSTSIFINTSVSLIHSSIVSLSVAGLLFGEVKKAGIAATFSHEELFSGCWQGAHFVLCFSCGYFAYDQWDMLYRHLYKPRAPFLLMHHAMLLGCFTTALYRNVTINYLILTLACEIHSVFLHLRRVLLMAGLRQPGTRLVLLEWSFNWITFFMARLLMHIIITIKLLCDASKFPPGIELPVALSGMAGLHVLNVILGVDLVKAYKKDSSRRTDS